MQYQYVVQKDNYEDFAAGRVILSASGSTSFPVRLASEIFQRCAHYLPDNERYHIYDPCCGIGYMLTVLGFFHGDRLRRISASDIDPNSMQIARDNLRLLTHEGLIARMDHLHQLISEYGKSSHHDALDSAANLIQRLPTAPIASRVWQANALQPSEHVTAADLIICDLPYGERTGWQQANAVHPPAHQLLAAQYYNLRTGGIIALISDKKQKAAHPLYTRLQHETAGKRRLLIFRKD